ncbi:phage tail protein [Collimonas sp.]|jgi:predicted phage tail protein|uniref:phage tail protein n=1 Tax=Collimonas sp. TaxID=1963772 RepID=UPI002B75002B|nr:phage tail protein [Collimonas sp.]HWX01431.1 phage tail protein [Collimonas sp.]
MTTILERQDIIGSGGGKGGGGSSAPIESPDSLHSISKAKTLDLISTGEIVGPVNGLQSVLLGGTPVQNPDGSLNFSNVTVDFRPGTQTQEPIAGFPSVENEVGVSVELKSETPWARSITNTQLSAVRVRLSVQGLSKTDTSNGNINGYRVEYAIELSTDNGSYVPVLQTAFDGKTTQTYERSHRVELPKASIGWTMRVRRITPNANSATVADRTNVVSVTEIIDAKFRYPMAALVGIQIDASQFQNIPVRSFHMRGRIIRVPTNYDASARTYTGIWDGTFKVAYTNNPAWILYDLILHDIYGLGRRITAAQVDRYELYRIAQYCDVLVSDGKGGKEPRYTCNVYLQQRVAAYKLVQDIAGIFHGVAYWAGSRIVISADMPDDPVYTYTAANVIDGKFSRAGSPKTQRYTVALVSWNDNTDGGRQKVEPVVDRDGLRRYGIQQIELAPIGCTSQAQAHRHGSWALLTSNTETDVLTFSTGLEYLRAAPGKIIRIVDPVRMGRRNGGRIRSATDRSVTVDKAPVIAVGDKITCMLPTAVPETRIVQSVVGNVVTVTQSWSLTPVAESVWSVDNIDLVAQKFRVLSVKDKGDLTFEITAVQHESGKYDYIDNGTRIEAPPITVIPPSVQPPPANVTIGSFQVTHQGIASTMMSISWEAARAAIAYQAEWKKDDGNWISLPRTGQLTVEVPGIYAGRYNARVRAINPMDVRSTPAYAPETQLTGKTTPPPTVTSLIATSLVMGIGLSWGFPAQGASDTQRTEIWFSRTPDRADAAKLADFAYPQNSNTMPGLAAGVSLFFWARLVDRSGNEGAFYPAGAGVNGQSSSDASPILDYLKGQITESELGKELLKPIQQIPTIVARMESDADGLAATQLKATIAANNAVLQEAKLRGAAITTEQTIRQSQTESLANQITLLTASVNDNASAVKTEQTARADGDSALASRIDTVVSKANDNTAAINSETTARTTADSALGQRIDAVSAKASGNAADILSEQVARANADGALSSRIDSVQANAGADADALAATQIKALVSANSAVAITRTELQARIGKNAAAIVSESTARSTADGALSSRIDSVQAVAGSASATAQTALSASATTDGKLTTMYTVKMQVHAPTGKTYAASFGLGIENNGGVFQSQFVVAADRFAVLDVNGTTVTSPFIVQGGQVFISQALIGTGWITNAMIGNTIQSTAVNSYTGQPVWILDKNGTFQMNGTGQARLVINSSQVLVYDGNGTLRVRLGLW